MIIFKFQNFLIYLEKFFILRTFPLVFFDSVYLDLHFIIFIQMLYNRQMYIPVKLFRQKNILLEQNRFLLEQDFSSSSITSCLQFLFNFENIVALQENLRNK